MISNLNTLKQQLIKQIAALRKLCGVGKKAIKAEIIATERHLKDNESPSELDLSIITKPFFLAYRTDPKNFHLPILDAFISLFTLCSNELYPDEELTKEIYDTIVKMHKAQMPDEEKMKCLRILSACLSSPSGHYFIHSCFLADFMEFFINIHSKTESPTIKEVSSMNIQECMRLYVDRYIEPIPCPEFSGVEEIAKYYTGEIVRNCLAVQEFLPGAKNAGMVDIDLVAVTKVLTRTIEQHKVPVSTQIVCTSTLLILLQSQSPFLETQQFKDLLRNDIHLALLYLSLDNNMDLAESTSELIQTVWNRFAETYVDELNEVLNNGLCTALSSPYPSSVCRALSIFGKLVQEPQFLVDAFINYDCDHSGYFKNIYENSMKLIVKHAYPEQTVIKIQTSALKTLVTTLENLWKYFKLFEDQPQSEPTDPQNFLEAKKAKDIFDQGLDMFKRSPMKGINFFIQHGYCESEPEKIAQFLFNTPNLDGNSIGEVIGGSKPLNLEILPRFVDLFDFKGKSFESAFRGFLSKFQIPGEAQMIDRVMEQFGTKFYNDNSELFSCADTVYVLAFSTLMLHTDAHHPNVNNRMTLDQFVANNKGIDGGKDLPFSFLENLYKGITSKAISLTSVAIGSTSLLTRQQQADLYKQQVESTLTNARDRTKIGGQSHQFHRAESPMLIGPMFHSVWGGILAALTMSFDQTEDETIIQSCLSGFQICTHIASHCYVEDALVTLVDSFAKSTRLQMKTSLHLKNFQCTNALIKCAIDDRNYLKGTWTIVLNEISALDKMKDDSTVVCDLRFVEELFTQTGSLDRESIIDLVQSMCEVSRQEINEVPSRTFTLLKFSTVAFWNMDRPMYIWKDIWGIMSKYLTELGRDNQDFLIVSATIDIVRQLSLKFLPKQEMTQFHFQENFLMPFHDVYTAVASKETKELILECIESIACGLASVIHSGWSPIIQILVFTAMDPDIELKKKAFSIVEKFIMSLFEYIRPHFGFLIMALSKFVLFDHELELAMQATAHFSLIADGLGTATADEWICVLQNVGSCTRHPSLEVRKCAEEVFISIVTSHGCMKADFTPEVWRFFLRNSLIDMFNVDSEASNNNSDVENNHLIELFGKQLFTHLFFKFPEAFKDYRDDIVNFISHVSHHGCFNLREATVAVCTEYVANEKEAFKSDKELMELLIKNIFEQIPRMTTSVQFVKMIGHFIEIFWEQNEYVLKFMEILHELSSLCETNQTNKEVYPTWCLARLSYFKALISQKRTDDFAADLKDILTAYQKFTSIPTEWNDLLVKCMKEMILMDNDQFSRCCDYSLQIVCQLIEAESIDVRNELINVLSRRLGN